MQLPNMWLPPLPNVCNWHKLLIFSNLLIIDTSVSVDGCSPSFLMSHMQKEWMFAFCSLRLCHGIFNMFNSLFLKCEPKSVLFSQHATHIFPYGIKKLFAYAVL